LPIRLYYTSEGIPETLQSTLRENALQILKSVPEGYSHVCIYIAYIYIYIYIYTVARRFLDKRLFLPRWVSGQRPCDTLCTLGGGGDII